LASATDKPKALLAASPEAGAFLSVILGGELALVSVHTVADAIQALKKRDIDVIVCDQHFDGSQMLRFLERVKADSQTKRLPFIGCRAKPTQLREVSLSAMREACEALGAVAYVDLLEREHREDVEAAAVEFRDAVRAAVSLEPKARSLRVLVADDNADAAHTLSVLLEMAGHKVHKAKDGEEAVQIAASFRPAVAVLDIGMPQMTGYAAAERIRAEPWGEEVTLIAVTAYGKPEEIARAFRAGFDHHFLKPVKFEHLLEVFPR
jgi:CheY-like chemotaxis protein